MRKIQITALLILALWLCAVSPQRTASSESSPKLCQVHGEVLKPQKVRIEYGYFDFNQDWLLGEEPAKLFPNAKQFLTGACKSTRDVKEDGSCVRRAGLNMKKCFIVRDVEMQKMSGCG